MHSKNHKTYGESGVGVGHSEYFSDTSKIDRNLIKNGSTVVRVNFKKTPQILQNNMALSLKRLEVCSWRQTSEGRQLVRCREVAGRS